MLGVLYEQAEQAEATTAAQASASTTIGAPLATLYASMRITWQDGAHLDVLFCAKGNEKSQLTIQQSKLRDADAVARSKACWGEALNRLKALLEA